MGNLAVLFRNVLPVLSSNVLSYNKNKILSEHYDKEDIAHRLDQFTEYVEENVIVHISDLQSAMTEREEDRAILSTLGGNKSKDKEHVFEPNEKQVEVGTNILIKALGLHVFEVQENTLVSMEKPKTVKL